MVKGAHHSSSDEDLSKENDRKHGRHPPVNSLQKSSTNSSNNSHYKAATTLLSLVDGVGLSFIAACTVLEGFQLWDSYFHAYWTTDSLSIIYWVAGRSFQVVGLFFLIFFALTQFTYDWTEQFGMFLLTVGPCLNMYASYIFEANNQNDDDIGLFTLEWMTQEIVELIGILFLDASFIEFEPEVIDLILEVVGFFFLCCSAMLDYDFSQVDLTNSYLYIPVLECRFGLVHEGEFVGLLMLTLVAFGQYNSKQAKHRDLHKHIKDASEADNDEDHSHNV